MPLEQSELRSHPEPSRGTRERTRAPQQDPKAREEQEPNRVGDVVEGLHADDGKKHTWKIVGEDEADAAKGRISHVSPMAMALFGKSVGDLATVNGKEWEIVALEAGE